jgi:hypothetical protein
MGPQASLSEIPRRQRGSSPHPLPRAGRERGRRPPATRQMRCRRGAAQAGVVESQPFTDAFFGLYMGADPTLP